MYLGEEVHLVPLLHAARRACRALHANLCKESRCLVSAENGRVVVSVVVVIVRYWMSPSRSHMQMYQPLLHRVGEVPATHRLMVHIRVGKHMRPSSAPSQSQT